MRNKMFKATVAIFLGILCLISFNTSAFSAGKYVLRYASEYMDNHPTIVNAIKPWIEEVKKLSNGRLEIQFFNPNALAPARDVYTALVAGSIDMVGSPCHWVHGKFPLATGFQLPLIFNGAEAGSLTMWDIYQKYPEWRDEYKDIKLLWHWSGATFNIHTSKKPVKTLEDLQGMKIIGINPQIREILTMLGVNTIDIPPQDAYLALERGMAEGMAFPIAPLKSFKITEVTKYHTIIDAMLDPFYGAINKDKWNSLPPDLQKILTDTTGAKLARDCGLSLDEGSKNDAKAMKNEGHIFYELSPEEMKKFRDRVQGLHDKWIAEREAQGIKNAREIHADIIRLGEKHSQETEGGYN